MSIKYIKKTVFNSNCDCIVNTINCDGVMGAGLALEFALRYPLLVKLYMDDCKRGLVNTGKLNFYIVNNQAIINFPTKDHWNMPSKVEWISSGLDYLIKHFQNWNVKSIAIPPLGCSNGGLNFERDVNPLIVSKLSGLDVDICICIDPGFAEGKEKEMVDTYNSSNISFLCDYLKIKGRAKQALIDYKEIKRFFEILQINDVGIATYRKLFNYFFNHNHPLIDNNLFS